MIGHWNRGELKDGPVGGTIAHLLWTLLFLKMYGTVDTMSRICKVDPVTYRKWTWLFLEKIAELHYTVVSNLLGDSCCNCCKKCY